MVCGKEKVNEREGQTKFEFAAFQSASFTHSVDSPGVGDNTFQNGKGLKEEGEMGMFESDLDGLLPHFNTFCDHLYN